MRQTVRMKDLAARLGLSQTTVSHVLSGRHEEFRISADTVERVRQMAQKLGYRSSALARAFRERRSFSIGLVVEDLTNPFWTGIAMGAERQAEKSGYTLVVSNTSFEVERERAALGLLRDGKVDGLLLPPFARIDRDLHELREDGLPFVQIDRALAKLDVPCVRTDHEAGSHLAVEHLVRRGHRRIAFVVGRDDIQPYHLRTVGFRAAMADHKLAPAAILELREATAEETQAAVAGLLRSGPEVSAIYAANVFMTVGTMRAVRGAGLDVPKDLEIVGFDDLPMADLMRFPVTTIGQDVHRIGAEAMALLMKVRASETFPREILVPPVLTVR
jgi:LacI family transcriptional regulator